MAKKAEKGEKFNLSAAIREALQKHPTCSVEWMSHSFNQSNQ